MAVYWTTDEGDVMTDTRVPTLRGGPLRPWRVEVGYDGGRTAVVDFAGRLIADCEPCPCDLAGDYPQDAEPDPADGTARYLVTLANEAPAALAAARDTIRRLLGANPDPEADRVLARLVGLVGTGEGRGR